MLTSEPWAHPLVVSEDLTWLTVLLEPAAPFAAWAAPQPAGSDTAITVCVPTPFPANFKLKKGGSNPSKPFCVNDN